MATVSQQEIDEAVSSRAVRASDHVGSVRERLPTLPMAPTINVGETRRLEIDEDDTERLRLEVDSSGRFEIEVRGIDGFDPFLYVYETAGRSLTVIDVNDDGGSGTDSSLELSLRPGTYQLEVEGFLGQGGECEVQVSRVIDFF